MIRHALFLSLAFLPCLGLAGCAPPDRWNAGYARQPAAGPLPARDTYSVGISGPLGTHPTPQP